MKNHMIIAQMISEPDLKNFYLVICIRVFILTKERPLEKESSFTEEYF